MIGIFGGTFDPVHLGHIAMAQELQSHLNVDEMRLLPCRIPGHRDLPTANAEHRLNMLELASEGTPLIIDQRELRREGKTYTIDTLNSFRNEYGPNKSLVLCMGSDSFATLPQWKDWKNLLNLAHIAVAIRPDTHRWNIEESSGKDLTDLLNKFQCSTAGELANKAHGNIYLTQLSQIPLSSTQVRNALKKGLSISDMLHPKVQNYIAERGLYKTQ